VDRVHVFLGTSVFADMPGTLAALWSCLRPGGRMVLVDVHAETLGLQGRLVQWMAGADLSRQAWTWLQEHGEAVEHVWLPHNPQHGGRIWWAAGTRPA